MRLRMRAAAEAEDDDVCALLRDGYAEVQRLIADVVRRGQAQGVFDAGADPDAIAWIWTGIGWVLDLNMMIDGMPCPPVGAGVGPTLLRLLRAARP